MEDNVKKALLDGSATIQTEIEILPQNEGENSVTLTEKNSIVSWDYEDFRYVKDEGWIGQFVAKQVNGVVKNISDDFSMTDKEFVLKMGVNLYYNIMNVDEETDGKHHIYGASEQKTTNGNQLVDFNAGITTTGETKTFENDVFTITGDGSSTYERWYIDVTDVIVNNPGKILYFDYEFIDLSKYTSNDNRLVQLEVKTSEKTAYLELLNKSGQKTIYNIPTDTTNIKAVSLQIFSNNFSTPIASTLSIIKPMLQFGTNKLDYEPYTGGSSPNPDYPSEIINKYNAGTYQTIIDGKGYVFTISDDLSGIDDVKNELVIDKENLTFEFTKRVGKIVLDGDWYWNLTNNVFYTNALNDYYLSNGTLKCLSNYYIGFPEVNGSLIAYNNGNNSIALRNKVSGSSLFIRDDRFTTVEEFKKYLSEHTITVCYALAEPVTITGTLEEKEYDTHWYSLGNFLVTKVTDDEVGDKTTFEALDYTKKFNQKYVDDITYPCTALELAQNVCQQCGCELGNTDFKHNDWEITGNAFTNGESCRDVLKAIGKLAYSWVRVDWDNKVYLDFTVNKTTEEYNKITNHEYYTLKTQKEKIGAINRVVIGYKDIEGERTKVENKEDIETNGVHEITIFDNPLVYNQELREKAIMGAEELLGLEYMPMEMLTVGHPWLRGDELLEVTDMEGKVHKTIPFDRTIQYFGHIKTNINVAANTKTNTEYSYESGISGKLQKAEISVDKINGEINSIVSRVDITETNINNTNVNLNNNYYDKNQIDVMNSSTSQELTQIKNSVETKITAEDLNIAIAEIKTTGVTSVTTETGYTFDKDGLKIQKSDSEMSSLLDNDGLVVKRDNTEVLTVRSAGVETENLTVRTYFTIGDNTRVENYKGGTGFFYVGGAD